MGFFEFYPTLKFSDEQIQQEDYKKHIGLGVDWDERGRTQLEFLKSQGLQPHHSLLDFGCGPLRGGVWFIDYLQAGQYVGIEQNEDFIKAAQLIIESKGLQNKLPVIHKIHDYAFEKLQRKFDFVVCWSVLNHCPTQGKQTFFKKVGTILANTGQLFVTHCTCFHDCEHVLKVGLVRQTVKFDFGDWADVAVEPIYKFTHPIPMI